jgi:hypothetical protein
MEVKLDYRKLEQAFKKAPEIVKDEASRFFTRSKGSLRGSITQSRWRIGSSGGGVPVDTGNLQKAHVYKITPTKLSITVNQDKAPYAKYVHGIDGYPRKRSYQLRPWLRWAEKNSEEDINGYAKDMLVGIVDKLEK